MSNIAKLIFSLNNPSAETITNIEIENLQCTIENQEYNEGKSEVIATLNNPVICVSQYSVMSISTRGAYNQEYTRDFAENERLIDVDFYREINTTDDWKNINKSPTENYILMQDLDFRNNPYDSVISTKCTGIIDGNNHTIRNIENNRDSIVLGIQNEVRNIYFENISFLNAGSWAGIISTVNKLENVHANNVKISDYKSKSRNYNLEENIYILYSDLKIFFLSFCQVSELGVLRQPCQLYGSESGKLSLAMVILGNALAVR